MKTANFSVKYPAMLVLLILCDLNGLVISIERYIGDQNFYIQSLHTSSKFECLASSRRRDITFESVQNPLPNLSEVW